MSILPSFPLQFVTFVCVDITLTAVGSVIVIFSIILQLLASVTITLYIPAVRFDISSDVDEFDHRY